MWNDGWHISCPNTLTYWMQNSTDAALRSESNTRGTLKKNKKQHEIYSFPTALLVSS